MRVFCGCTPTVFCAMLEARQQMRPNRGGSRLSGPSLAGQTAGIESTGSLGQFHSVGADRLP